MRNTPTILLRDLSEEMTSEWRQAFAQFPEVEVSCGDILNLKADAIVSPANSFGYMDGGIDQAYSHFFGWEIQTTLQQKLFREHFGELPVGQAVILPTGHKDIPLLISAPTMRIPSTISNSLNAYLAFRAVLILIVEHNRMHTPGIDTVLVPGMGTGVGRMPYGRAANQMRAAYEAVIGYSGTRERNLGEIWREHALLLS